MVAPLVPSGTHLNVHYLSRISSSIILVQNLLVPSNGTAPVRYQYHSAARVATMDIDETTPESANANAQGR